jgi:thioredoxin-related protein
MRSALLAVLLAATLAALVPVAAAAADAPTPKVIKGGGAAPSAEKIRWVDLGVAMAEAKRTGRPLLVDVQTEWCGWCRKMEKTTYADSIVREYLGRKFVASRVDAEDDESRVDYAGASRTHRQFADSFRISGYPTTLFFAADGSLLTQVPGYVKPDQFLAVLRYIGEGHYKTMSWDAWQRAGDSARP